MARGRKSSASSRVPDPPRPLAQHGRRLWDDVHRVGRVGGSIEPLLMLCERLDERSILRVRVIRDNDPAERAGLRALDAQIDEAMQRLGIRSLLAAGSSSERDDWTRDLSLVEG